MFCILHGEFCGISYALNRNYHNSKWDRSREASVLVSLDRTMCISIRMFLLTIVKYQQFELPSCKQIELLWILYASVNSCAIHKTAKTITNQKPTEYGICQQQHRRNHHTLINPISIQLI